MSYPRVRFRAYLLLRSLVAAVCAVLLAVGAVPVASAAAPAPRTPKRCDEWAKLTGNPSKPGTLPVGNETRVKSAWDTYDYVNQRQSMDGLAAPTPDDLLKAGTDPDVWKEGDPRKVYASYNRRQTTSRPYTGTFQDWLNDAYIENAARRTRGEAFHKKVVQDLNLVGPDWLCEVDIDVKDADGKVIRRLYDAVNHKTKEFVEIKSGGAVDDTQVPKDRQVLKDPRFKDYSLRYVFGQEPEASTTTRLRGLSTGAGQHPDGKSRVTAYQHRSTPVVRFTPGPHTKFDPTLNPNPQANSGSRGGLNDMLNQSKPTPESMRQQMERIRQGDPTGQRLRGPGGVDFSTLELRFVGAPVRGEGLDYSFTAEKMPDPDTNPGFGGQEQAQLISDSFFTWLALTPEKFWVNLNPDEPQRVMDAQFGKTDAGRVLLEADLQMKHDFVAAMNPKTELGRQFWDENQLTNGLPCLHGIRNWIEPEPAQVREQDGGIYILDAPLKVNSVPQEFDFDLPGDPCKPTKAQIEHNQKIVEKLIVPAVEKKISQDPAYAELRRVYTSRVAAEWIRLQDANKATDYHTIINSGDVSKWPIRGEKWDFNETWQQYLKSFRDGDYKFEWEAGGQVYVYTMGGVDFSKSPKENVSTQKFTAEHQYLPRSTRTSVQTMTDDAESDDLLLLGGNTRAKPTTGDAGTPPGGGGSDDPPAGGGGGGLPITGDSVPVPVLVCVALALILAGAALTWRSRRRRRIFVS
ncbi:hypothetical protein C7C45_27935 [Micromonospora arborensis]|uniref:LPXTG cell wall anchor domain-containing protein n=2 Tax=Micromonospora arborensis TaxID=2116518 RepID=A0A318NG15_9ACTN|nr:hypothetical protein C7C45_27935 [Micromonospora arborensis]